MRGQPSPVHHTTREIRSLLWIFPPNCMEPSCLSRNDDGELPDGLTLVPSSHGRCFGWDFTMSRRSPVIWATNRLGDRRVGDKPTGRQPTGRHILVNWVTEVETTGPQLWKCKRLTISVLEQLCAVLVQRPFNITHQTNIPHSSLECYEVAGLIDASQLFSEPNCASVFSAHIRLFTHN